MPVTTPDRYALGRNTLITLVVKGKFATDFEGSGGWIYSDDFDTQWVICVSEASVTLETDTIEIPSNCQFGWKVKLPGLKSGTVSGTGYIAMPPNLDAPTGLEATNVMKYLGDPCQIMIENKVPALSNKDAFNIVPPSADGANGFIKNLSVTISPDDATRVNFAIELSGSQDVVGFLATSDQF